MKMPWLLPVLVLGYCTSEVRAHNLSAEWKIADGAFAIEAFFSDDTPARGAKVQLFDRAKKVVAEATTDDKGKCSLPLVVGEFELLVDAGAGHRHRETIRFDGMLPAEPTVGGVARAEATQFPWGRVAIGCGVIALFGCVFWWSRRSVNRSPT